MGSVDAVVAAFSWILMMTLFPNEVASATTCPLLPCRTSPAAGVAFVGGLRTVAPTRSFLAPSAVSQLQTLRDEVSEFHTYTTSKYRRYLRHKMLVYIRSAMSE